MRSKNKKLLAGHAVVLLVVAMLCVLTWLGIGVCPLRHLWEVGCPFCGMTRAHLALLRGDPAAAIDAHPLFPIGIPYVWLLMHESLFRTKRSRMVRIGLIVLLTAVLLGEYALRILRFVGGF